MGYLANRISKGLLITASLFLQTSLARDAFYYVHDQLSLSDISLYLYGKNSYWKQIAEWNNIEKPYTIHLKQKLILKKAPLLSPEEGNLQLLKMWYRRMGIAYQPPVARPEAEPVIVKTDPSKPNPMKEFTIPNWVPTFEKPEASKNFLFYPALGINSFTFAQTGFNPYSSTNLAAGIRATYLLSPPKWDITFETMMDFSQLKKSNDNINVKKIFADIHLGYGLPLIKEPWRLSLQMGVKYNSMVVTNNFFGFRNLIYPQLFPSIRKIFKDGTTASLYGKYSPLDQNFRITNFSERDFTVGLSVSKPVTAKNPLTVDLRHSDMRYHPKTNTSLKATSSAIILSYGF